MDTKELLKWGVLIVLVLLAFRWVRGFLAVGDTVPQLQVGAPMYAPNYYAQGVYGQGGYPVTQTYVNPFYSSPDNPRGGQWRGGPSYSKQRAY